MTTTKSNNEVSKFKSIEIIELKDAEVFLDYLRPSKEHWGTASLNWYFRGHGDSSWLLQPYAWRSDGQNILRPILKALKPGLKVGWAEQKNMIPETLLKNEEFVFENVLQNATEMEAVRQFADLADRLGYPISADNLISGMTYLVNFPGPYGWPSFNTKTEFYFAQHHGVPSRFMDWTRKPLIAAFFAAEAGINLQNSGSAKDHICVWAINETFLKTHFFYMKHKLSIKTCPRHQHSFLHAQDGLFIYHEDANLFFIRNGEWPTFEKIIEESYDENYPKPLRKITLPIEKTGDLLNLLGREDITRAHLMPTYDNITTTLKSNWGLKDETSKLKEELESAKQELAEFQCPYCQAPLGERAIALAPGADDGDLMETYECGYGCLGGRPHYPCPYDPNFPKFEDFELVFYQHESGQPSWTCFAKLKDNKFPGLDFHSIGPTKEEAESSIRRKCNAYLKRRGKSELIIEEV